MTVLINSGTTIGIPSGGISLTDAGTIAAGLDGSSVVDAPFNFEGLSTGALLPTAGLISIDTDQLLNQGTIGQEVLPGLSNIAEATIDPSVSFAEGQTSGISIQGESNAGAVPVDDIANSFSGTVTFTPNQALEVVLQSPDDFTGTMLSMDNTSTIVLDGIVANSASLGPLSSSFLPNDGLGSLPILYSGSLNLLNTGSTVYSFDLAFEGAVTQFVQGGIGGPSGTVVFGQDYSSAVFTATPDALNDNTTITVSGVTDLNEFISSPSQKCFAAGTRIATPDGEVPIEQLKPGGRVIAHFGGERRVVWTGHRAVDRSRSPDEVIGVVRIAAGAFGEGCPKRDLLLSPGHAVFVGDVLVPARYLTNGTTIREVAMDTVTFWHVELDAHDVILAEGLPAESFLDIGDRSFFNEYDRLARSDVWRDRLAWEAVACAPLVVTGPKLLEARAKIREAALA